MKPPATLNAPPAAVLNRNVAELAELLPKLNQLGEVVQQICDACLRCWQGGGKLLIAGNGGSAADAMHFAEELLVRFCKNRKALPAIALCDPTVITCTANDFSYNDIFSRQVQGLGKPGDVLILLTTSGNSTNCLHALDAAKSAGMVTIAFTGKDGGQIRGRCDLELVIPSTTTHHIQEAHKIIYHAICEWVDTQFD